RPTYYPSGADELITLVLPQGLVLVGETDTVERAQRILADLESQLEDPSEKIIYWYTCKHSNPKEIAEVLSRVYDSLTGSGFEKKPEAAALPAPPPPAPQTPTQAAESQQGPFPYIAPGSTFNPVMPATAPFVQPGLIDKDQKISFGNFI